MNSKPMSDAESASLPDLVAEVEQFVHTQGWDQPRQLFALVPTAELLAHEPALVGKVQGAAHTDDAHTDDAHTDDAAAELSPLTPIEQGNLPKDSIADSLATIAWPRDVAGCILVLEVGVDNDGDTHEGRLAVGVLRDHPAGSCALRWRHAPNGPVTRSEDLAPELIEALQATFAA